MLDLERLLAKIDELDGYRQEIHEISPENFEEFKRTEKKRACERLLQVSIESVIDICALCSHGSLQSQSGMAGWQQAWQGQTRGNNSKQTE